MMLICEARSPKSKAASPVSANGSITQAKWPPAISRRFRIQKNANLFFIYNILNIYKLDLLYFFQNIGFNFIPVNSDILSTKLGSSISISIKNLLFLK
jgi:hypothetical protein